MCITRSCVLFVRTHTLGSVCFVFPKHILALRTTWLWCLCTDLVCCVYFSPVVVYFFLIHRRLFLPLLLVLFNNGNELNGKCFTCAEEESHTKEQQKYKKKNAAHKHSACFTNNWFEQCIQTKRHKKKKNFIYIKRQQPVQSNPKRCCMYVCTRTKMITLPNSSNLLEIVWRDVHTFITRFGCDVVWPCMLKIGIFHPEWRALTLSHTSWFLTRMFAPVNAKSIHAEAK